MNKAISDLILNKEESLARRDSLLYTTLQDAPYFCTDFTNYKNIYKKDFSKQGAWLDHKEVTKHKYLQCNHPLYINILVVDIDYSWQIAFERALECAIPPNFIIKNKGNHKAHFIYVLTKPINLPMHAHEKNKPNTNSNSYRLYDVTKNKLRHILKGDTSYNHRFCKNPWNTNLFEIIATAQESYDVKDLGARLPDIPFKELYSCAQYNIDLSTIDIGFRNDSLFHYTRFKAYALKKIYGSNVKELRNEIKSIAIEGNMQFKNPLPLVEVDAMVASIVRYVISHKCSHKKNKGAANVSLELTLGEKQREGAYYTHQIRKVNTQTKLKLEMAMFLALYGHIPSKNELQEVSSITKTTINTHWESVCDDSEYLFELASNPELSIPLKPRKEEKTSQNFERIRTAFIETTFKQGFKFPAKKELARIVGIDIKTIRSYYSELLNSLQVTA